MKKPFTCYAVARGRAVGVFDTWATCAASVRGYGPAARYRGFYSRYQAEEWLKDERARMDEARWTRRKKRSRNQEKGAWQFIPATEPIQESVVSQRKAQE